MQCYTFSTQEGKAYYYNSIPAFIDDDSHSIIGKLVEHSFDDKKEQDKAWGNQISQLQKRLKECGMQGDIIFEYDIVRLGKRIDVILLIRHMVFSLEFKNGQKQYIAADAQQAEDYAIDLKNFHKESENLYVCPILIATKAEELKNQTINCYADKQIQLQKENIETFIPKVEKVAYQYGEVTPIDFEKWFNSPYYPTPSIVQAAVETYSTKDKTEIAHSEAGQENIDACEKDLQKIIDDAKTNHKKCICFITGVPGAGKTLVGLNLAMHNMEKGADTYSVYISGNGPLVKVLRAALEKSAKVQDKKRGTHSAVAIRTLIQGSYEFRNAYSGNQNITPEHILIFDEAQRVWDEQKLSDWIHKKGKTPLNSSEPQFLIDVMNRQTDWAVIVCLVGLGQDIYDGEVGINEWFSSAINHYSKWELYYSPAIFDQVEEKNINRQLIENFPNSHALKSLHLNTSIRSFRADKQSQFVDLLLDNKPEETKKVYNSIHQKYPIFLTRNLDTAKKWTRNQVRGSQRCGILASSTAQRLRPEGIYVTKENDVKNWFLASSDDLRSSNRMEIPATEFDIQGLEIDWSLVCWDADLRRINKNQGWGYYYVRGKNWCQHKALEQQRYLLNSYRVLLTRARQGMVIFVPNGVDKEEDSTRDHTYYDAIYHYLLSCGIEELK